MLIDTHCHLNFQGFENDFDEVIKRALEAGVTKIINVGADLASSQKAVEIAQKYDGCYASIGIHPHHADKLENGWEEQLKDLAQQPKVVAMGEIGLDYYSYQSNGIVDPQIQKKVFLQQIDLAHQLKLPIIFHSRKSADDMFAIIKPPVTGVFHCYAAGKSGILKVVNLGLYFGIDGNLTYDQGLQNVVSGIPLEKIILETDAPWLAPVPFRSQRNEPKNVKIISEYLAGLKKVSPEEVETRTTKNALKLFNL